jgi:hypothetical protein
MADDAGLRVVAMQLLQELVEGCLLLWSTRIGSLSTSANAALVADAERAAVVASGVGSTNSLGKDWDEIAVTANIPVIRWLTEFRIACCNEVIYREITVAARGGAVNHIIKSFG